MDAVQEKTLVSELTRVCLDVEYWLDILKTKCGITQSGQLEFMDDSMLNKLQKFVRYEWEMNALKELVGVRDTHNVKQRKDQEHEREERAVQLVADLKVLKNEGKSRHDKLVKEKEDHLRQVLNVPNNEWIRTCKDESMDSVIDKLSGQLGEIKELARSRNELSPTELLERASGGLVLKGILVVGDVDDCIEVRKSLIQAPKVLQLKSPMTSQKDNVSEFSSRTQSDRFHRSLDTMGHSMAASAKGGGFGFQAEAGFSKSHQTEHRAESETHHSEVYRCREMYSCIPMAVVELDKRKLAFTDAAFDDLRKLEMFIQGTSDERLIQEKSKDLLRSYGSHVNVGSIEFGGIYHWRATCSRQTSSNRQTTQDMLQDALSGFVSMSYSGFGITAGGSVSGEQVKAHAGLSAAYNDSDLSLITMNVIKKGGPQEVTSLPVWKMGLVKCNETWAVIDRGSSLERDFVGLWELIRNNGAKFSDADKLAQTLQHAWGVMTGTLGKSDTRSVKIEDALNELNAFLEDNVCHWAEDPALSRNTAGYLQKLHDCVDRCCTATGDHRVWVNKLKSDKSLVDFLKKIMHIRADFPPPELLYIQRHLKGLMKLAADHDFPLRNDIVQWLLMLQREDEVVPSIIGNQEIKDIPSLINVVNEMLLPAMHTLAKTRSANVIDVRATTDLALAVEQLRLQLDKANKKYDHFLLLISLLELNFDSDKKSFTVLITTQRVETFISHLENLWGEFQDCVKVGEMQTQAFLISSLLTLLPESDDEEYKEQELWKYLKEIQNFLTSNVMTALNQMTSTSPYQWSNLLALLTQLKTGNKDVLVQSAADISDLKNILSLEKPEIFSDHSPTQESDNTGEHTPAKRLLERLGLTSFYPSKISLQDVMAVSKRCSIKGTELSSLPWKILQKLIMLDYNGRDNEIGQLVSKEAEGANVDNDNNEDEEFTFDDFINDIVSEDADTDALNPLDVFLTLYSCCDMILKQTLLQKMFTCRLAVPLVSPQMSEESLLFTLWALRSIIVEWKGKDQTCMETSVVNQPGKIVSFLRLRKQTSSKSLLLNNVISDQAHHTFWNRECPGGGTEYSVADGLVEAQWFLPTGKPTDVFNDVTMFLNIRGDSIKHPKQVKLLQTVSNVIVCCLEIQDLNNPAIQETMKGIHSSSAKVVLYLTTKDPESLKQQTMKTLYESYVDSIGKSNMVNTKVISGFKGSKSKTTVDLKQEIRKVVQKFLVGENGHSIEDASCIAKSAGMVVDEDDGFCKVGKELAQQVIACMGDKPTHVCKNQMLPLQGGDLHKWSQLLKDKERSGRKETKTNVIRQMDKIQQEMTALRQSQLEHCKHLSLLMRTFLKHLLQVVDSPAAPLFLQWMKIHLDEKSRKTLPGLRNDYQKRWTAFNDAKAKGGLVSTEGLRNELQDAEKLLAEASLGLEHLFRETAQIYEAALESKKELDKETLDAVHSLPTVAAKLLLQGQPIEIMDGDAANVPLTWVKAVFSSLTKLIGDKKLYVISVLGVQSSGKSTLLNTMFGLQFAVSAGRCTRGANMQLVEVDQEGCDYDFVLVVDTEGLRAPELGQSKHCHDNELATFVIGLGDVTIINVKGENMAEMVDVLQIAVHAFLRMKMINRNFQLHRNCIFIHQNVPAVNAKDKMQQGCQKLQESLDEMTVEACAIENIADIHTFNQVIDFDREKHVWYFSDLWHGDPPMAPPNPGYTRKVQEVKDCLLNDLSQQQTFLKFTDMTLRIKDIWGGVLSDDFVFSFRNSLAAKAYNSLESKYYELSWNVESSITEWVNENAIVQLESCISYDDLEQCHAKLLVDLEVHGSIAKESAQGEMERFFDEDNLRDILIEWKVETLNSLTRDTAEFLNRAQRDVLQTKDTLRIDLIQRVKQKQHEEEIFVKAKELADATRGKGASDAELQARFDSVWIQWSNELANRSAITAIPIEKVVERLLWQHLTKDSAALRKELKNNPLDEEMRLHSLEGSITVDDILESYLSVKTTVGQSIKSFFTGRNPWLQCREAAVQSVNAILSRVDVYLTDLSKLDSRFQESYATFVIKTITDGVQLHNQQYTKQYPFTLLPNLRVKLAVHASRYAIRVFRKIQRDYDETHSIAKKLDAYKGTAWNLFKNMVKQASKEVIAADLLVGCLEERVKQIVERKMPTEIVDEIVHHFGHSKFSLMLAILDDLALNGSFESYKSFLTNSKDYTMTWVTSFSNDKFLPSAGKEGQYVEYAGRHIHSIVQSIENSIKSATEALAEATSEIANIQKWCKHFRATVTNLHITEADLKHVMGQNVVNFRNFERLLIDRLPMLEERALTAFKKETSDTIKWQGTTPYRQIMDKLWGCEAQCPFCNEPCMRTDPDHVSKSVSHECIQHRPSGIGGDRWDEDYRKDKLVIESCNYQVQWKSLMFNCRDCKFECRKSGRCSTTGSDWVYHSNIEYKTFLPKWDIAPSNSMESCKYWMWFMATYKHQLKDMHNAQLPDVPDSWYSLTKQEAADSLRKYSN